MSRLEYIKNQPCFMVSNAYFISPPPILPFPPVSSSQGQKGKQNLQPMKAFGIVVSAPLGTVLKPLNAAYVMSEKAPLQGTLAR